MNIFQNSKVVKLRGYHGTYLLAVDDQTTITQGDDVSSKEKAQWTVELVPGSDSVIRLKSCYCKYLTASEEAFLTGVTAGCQVHQTVPENPDSSIDWEPVREVNNQPVFKLKNSRHGTFLRANKQGPVWQNSVTHKVPLRTSSKHCQWHVITVSTTEQTNSSTPQMTASQGVPPPASAPAPAPASGQGFAKLAVNAAKNVRDLTKPEDSEEDGGKARVTDAGHETGADTTGPENAGSVSKVLEGATAAAGEFFSNILP